MKADKPTQDGNHGERDRERDRAARRYVREFVASDPPPTKVPLDELVAKGHTLIDRVQLLMRRIARRFGRR